MGQMSPLFRYPTAMSVVHTEGFVPMIEVVVGVCAMFVWPALLENGQRPQRRRRMARFLVTPMSQLQLEMFLSVLSL